MKILNLYAGIGGNRKLWGDEHEITAIEINPKIAVIYKKFFPKDKVMLADAHQYLLDHYKEFDFIWSSPPCPTHSTLRTSLPDDVVYPDMRLYQEIILLQKWFKGKWVVENVVSYYTPLIKPQRCERHYFWSNFTITNIPILSRNHNDVIGSGNIYGFDISKFDVENKRLLLRNCVNPKVGLHIFNCAFKIKQQTLV